MRLILLSAPGAGKGTQAERLSKELKIPIISTGDILREAIAEESPLGRKAGELINRGEFVPDDAIIDIIRERLEKDDCDNGYILDGVPRTVAQAEAIEKIGIKVDKVLFIDVPDGEIIKRLKARRVCVQCGLTFNIDSNPPETEGKCDECGGELVIREDDMDETVIKRLETYHEKTEQLKEFYGSRGMLLTVDGKPGIDEITAEIKNILGI